MLSSECSLKNGNHISKSAWDNRLSSIYIRPESGSFDPTSTTLQYVTMAVANVSKTGQIVITRSRCRMSPAMIATLQSLHLSRMPSMRPSKSKATPPQFPMAHGDRFTFIPSQKEN